MSIINPENWVQRFDESRFATLTEGKITTPIAGFNIPFVFTNPILVVRCLSPGHFDVGGTIQQVLPSLAFDNVQLTGDIFPLFLNVNRIIQVKDWGTNYSIAVQPRIFLPSCRLTIWEYTGADSQNGNLIKIQQDVTEIKELIGG